MIKNKPVIYLILIAILLILFQIGCGSADGDGESGGGIGSSPIQNEVETIISDMQLPHEGRPHGVPTDWDWASGPVIGWGSNPPPSFNTMTAWGQVYEDESGNPAQNTRVQITHIKAYMLSKSDRGWWLLQAEKVVDGAAFREDFVDDFNIPGDVRYEADGSISVKAGGGYNFHFWPPQRAGINPNDIAGIFTTVQARLVIDDPSQPDDRSQARYLLNMGGDYWLGSDAAGIGMGRFKYVKTEWMTFNMTTLSEEDIRENPPPLD